MRRSQHFLLCSTATALLALPLAIGLPSLVHAQSVDEAGAIAIEQRVIDLVERVLSDFPDSSYSFAGPVDAVPAETNYAVSIPELTIDFRSDVRVISPAYDAIVTPLDEDRDLYEWSYPPSLVVMNPTGSERFDLSYTSQDNELVFSQQYNVALEGDIGFENLVAEAPQMNATITADSLAMVVDTSDEPSAPHTYDSETSLALSNLDMNVEGEFALSLANFEANGDSERQRLDLFAALDENTRGIDPDSEAFAAAFVGVLQEHRGEKWMAGISLDAQIDDVAFSGPDASGELEHLLVSIEGSNLDQPSSTVGITFEAEGISSPQLPPAFARIIPTVASLDLEALDAPIESAFDVLYDAIGEPLSEEEQIGPKGRRAGAGLDFSGIENLDPSVFLALLLDSDAAVELHELYLEAPIGYISGEGRVEPAPQAALQAVGTVSLDIAGLSDMIAFAQQMGGEAAQISGVVSIIAAMGRDGTDDDGRAIKEFDIELTEAGQFLLNGNDMSAMLGMFP